MLLISSYILVVMASPPAVDGPTGNDGLHGAVLRQHDEIGVGSRPYSAFLRHPERLCRGLGRHTDGVSHGNPQKLDRAQHGPIHRERAAGEDTVGQPHRPDFEPHLLAAQLVLPGRHPGGSIASVTRARPCAPFWR